LATLLALPAPAAAGLIDPDFFFGPFFTGKFDDYGFPIDLPGIKAKTGTIGKGCPVRRRGALLQVKQVPQGQTHVNGFFALFGDANQKRQPVTADLFIDVSKLDTPTSFAAVEIDTPFVPVGQPVPLFASVAVSREANDSLQVFVATTGGNVGTPLVLPGDVPAVRAQLVYDGTNLDVSAGACDAVTLTAIVTDHPFVFDGSTGMGAGIHGAKGDVAGFAFAITGDLHDAAKQDVLGDLQAVIDLENAALMDLAGGNPADARTKIEQSRALLEDQGPEVQPPTMPATFEPDLLEKVGALPAGAPRDEAVKRLEKARDRDVKARDKIDKGGPKDLKDAQKQLEKARDEKLRAKAILEANVVAEAKGV
jgi:hypothetical protein